MTRMKAEHRKRCLEEPFLNSLLSGELKNLVDLVKKDKTLQLCFRGAYVSVYYKGDSLFKIRPLARGYKVSFDKIKQVLGFSTTRNIGDGIKEVLRLIDGRLITDFENKEYHNS